MKKSVFLITIFVCLIALATSPQVMAISYDLDVVLSGSTLPAPQSPTLKGPSDAVQLFKIYPDRVLFTTLILVGPGSESGQAIDTYQSDWRNVRTALNGNDLIAMGLEPGPAIGRLLSLLLEARLDGKVRDEAGERKMLSELMRKWAITKTDGEGNSS